MRKTFVAFLAVAFVLSLSAVAFAKDVPSKRSNANFMELPNEAAMDIPADLAEIARPSLVAAVADTFKLGCWGFEVAGQPNAQGWVAVDLTNQLKLYYHRANNTELNGGTFGNLIPLAGSWSMWCGQVPTASNPWCGWQTLPGYGNGWDQLLTWVGGAGDSVQVTYKVFWDSEPGYDFTDFEYSGDGGATWTRFTVGGGESATAGRYDGTTATTPFLTETFGVGGLGSVDLRFRSSSDGAWSDQDGLWPTDGMIVLDDIVVSRYAGGVLQGTTTDSFEAAGGSWTPGQPTAFGLFASMYPGVTVLQEDPCFVEFDPLWQWVDNPLNTNYACHTPDPRPDVGAMPFGGAAKEGLYISNEIWSPEIDLAGTAGAQFRLYLRTYRDLPLDNLQFYVWAVRGIDASNCASTWGDDNFVYYGGQKDWLYNSFNIGTRVPSGSLKIQVAVGAVDMCGVWCNIYGTGACHSHAPIIDDVCVERVNVVGPQFVIRHINMLQDNFAEDGTLTGTARADVAIDILPSSNGNILPGDSMAITVTGLGNHLGGGRSLYLYASAPGKVGANMEAPEVRAGAKRFPLVGSVVSGATTWYQFRFDSTFTSAGGSVLNGFCVDLNDNLFTPGDVVSYFIGGDDGAGNANYFSRRLNGQGANFITTDVNEAASSPCEFTILPGPGYEAGGDILYVDDADDRGGPSQLFVDTALDMMQLRDQVDRFDVLGPSSTVGNSLASRVKNVATQLTAVYRKILWISSDLSIGLVGDGGTPNGGGGSEKSDDFGMLFQWIDTHPDNPGVYFAGDDHASQWAFVLTGAGAVNFRSIYMNFNLDPAGNAPPENSHVVAGEPISPVLTGVGPAFAGDQLVAYGGCAAINDFDLVLPTGASVAEMNSASGRTYMVSQATPNSNGSTARVILSGVSYNFIRDLGGAVAVPARVTHLQHVLEYFVNLVPAPTGIDTKTYANNLDNNYPNPFNPTTTIAYSIKESGNVTLKVYNAAGQLVRTLVNESQVPREGGFSVQWDGKNNLGQPVSSGVYFYKLSATNFSQTKKMVLLK